MTQCPYNYYEYQIQPQDTLKSVAERFSVSEQLLRDKNGTDITPGRRLKIPCAFGGCDRGFFYTVRRGETLLRIAQRHGLTLADLLADNPYLNPMHVATGQVIVIAPAKKPPADGEYTLADGEGLFDVLRKFGMDLTTFCALNPGVRPMELRGGRRVHVRRHAERGGRWYTLEPGDTLVSVALRHGVPVSALLRANERLRPGDFVPGMPVRIPGELQG